MLSPVTVSPVITAFHSCCLSHHVFDQVNLWPAWVGFETAIFIDVTLINLGTEALWFYEIYDHIETPIYEKQLELCWKVLQYLPWLPDLISSENNIHHSVYKFLDN